MIGPTQIHLDWNTVEYAVLDMDGTLLDLYFDDQVWNTLLPRRYGEVHATDEARARDEIDARMVTRRGTLIWYCLDHWSRSFAININSLEAELESFICVRPEAQAFLEFLVGRGVYSVLATNAHPKSLARKLRQTGIGSYFEDIVSSHDLGVAKERTAFWRELETRAGIVAARTIVVDDNHDVLRAAREYGIDRVYGILQPNSRKAPIPASEFTSLASFSELTGC